VNLFFRLKCLDRIFSHFNVRYAFELLASSVSLFLIMYLKSVGMFNVLAFCAVFRSLIPLSEVSFHITCH
jgi:hypothetical protein